MLMLDDLPRGCKPTITMFGSSEPPVALTAKTTAETMSLIWLPVLVEGHFKPGGVTLKRLLTERSSGD